MRNRIYVLFIALSLCGCSKREDWWVGTWRLDVEYTKSMMNTHWQPPYNRLAIELSCRLNGNSDYVITKNKIGIMMGGVFVGGPYSILRRESDTSVVYLFGETTNTMCLQDGFLIQKVPGENSRDAEYYFRPKP